MPTLEQIRDFQRISPQLATAGQPTHRELAAIAAAGFDVVVNLLPTDSLSALPDEEAQVRALGMDYIQIPIVWERPRLEDLERFMDVMDRHRQRHLFVHCAANLRVSTFLALYRVLREGWSWRAAQAELRRIWIPNPVWQAFVLGILRARRRAEHPWCRVTAADYQAHMGSAVADQLAPLSRIFAAHYARRRPARVAVLGCACGNGFEHVDPRITRQLIGIDINPAYLLEAGRRFAHRVASLRLICARAERCPLPVGSVDLVSAALIFEYVDPPAALREMTALLAPGGALSVVLQLPSREEGVVTQTPHASLRGLEEIMQLVAPDELEAELRQAGFFPLSRERVALRIGKGLHAGLYARS